MDVLTDSSLTLIVKTSEPENANVGESTGENPSSSSSHILSIRQMCIHDLFLCLEKKHLKCCCCGFLLTFFQKDSKLSAKELCQQKHLLDI